MVKRLYYVSLPDTGEVIILARVGAHPILSTHLGMHTFRPESVGPIEFVLFSSFENILKIVPYYLEGQRPDLRHAVIVADMGDWRSPDL